MRDDASKHNVLFLVNHLHKGGMQRAVSNITSALREQVNISVGYFGTENPGFEFGGRLHDFGLPPAVAGSMLGKGITLVRRLFALRAYVVREEIHVVVSFGETANLYNLLAFHRGRKVISVRVAVDEGLRASGRYAWAIRLLVGAMYPRADLVVAASKDLKTYIESRWEELSNRVIAIPNLYDINEIRRLGNADLPEGHKELSECNYIVAVGSLVHQKGFDILIEAFAKIKARGRIKLVLCGRGHLLQSLRQLAHNLNVSMDVIFVDFDPNPYRYVSKSMLFVLSSRFEGFPNVLVEAMALGIPVVSFDCPTGPSEILGDGQYGSLVKDVSADSLAAELERVLGSPVWRAEFARKAYGRALQYDRTVVASAWYVALSRALAQSTRN